MEHNQVKTLVGWHESHLDLNHYLAVGDEVDEAMFDYFLGVLPPAYHSSSILQIGEPYNHFKGWETYSTLARKGGIACDGPWYYAGHCLRGHSQEPK